MYIQISSRRLFAGRAYTNFIVVYARRRIPSRSFERHWRRSKASSVTPLDKDSGERRPQYAAYIPRSNAFFPGRPKQ
jgi:hypothetical protein